MAQTNRQTAKPISSGQIKRIHQIISILKISDDNYRAALDSRFNVTTCKLLTLSQAHAFIAELEKLALKAQEDHCQIKREEARQIAESERPKRFDNLDNRAGFASAAQLRKLEAMWQDISTIPDQAARGRALRNFIKRITGVADMRFLNMEDAGKVINAMSAIQKRETELHKSKPPKNAA